MTVLTTHLARWIAIVLVVVAGHASGAEIVLEQTAVQKLIDSLTRAFSRMTDGTT